MCVLYVSVVYFEVQIALIYSTGSGVNKVQVVLSGFSVSLFCPYKSSMQV